MALVIANQELPGLSDRTCPRQRIRIALLVAAFAAWYIPALLHAENTPTEYDVKAAYLYQFGKFVEWPPETSGSSEDVFSICTFGEDPFGPVLDKTISGRFVQGKRVIAKRLTNPDDTLNCNILFISLSEQDRLDDVLRRVRERSILTVGNTSNFLLHGGVINFQVEQSKVRFEINLAAAHRAKLKVSSQLLKVATLIKE